MSSSNRISKYYGFSSVPFLTRNHSELRNQIGSYAGKPVEITYIDRSTNKEFKINTVIDSYKVIPVTVAAEKDSYVTSGYSIIQLHLKNLGSYVFVDGDAEDLHSNTKAVGLIKTIKLFKKS